MKPPVGYRAYVFGAKAHVERRAAINAPDDEAAIEQLKQLAGKREAELWHGTRLVCMYRTNVTPASRPGAKDE